MENKTNEFSITTNADYRMHNVIYIRPRGGIFLNNGAIRYSSTHGISVGDNMDLVLLNMDVCANGHNGVNASGDASVKIIGGRIQGNGWNYKKDQ